MDQLPQRAGHAPAPVRLPQRPPAAEPEGEPATPEAAADLSYLLRVLAGRRWLIGALVAAGTGAAALGVSQMSDRFTAESLLLADNRQIRIVREVDSGPNTILNDDAQILSQVEILKSDEVLGRVVDELHLADHPDFVAEAPGAVPEPLVGRLTGLGHRLSGWLWSDGPPAAVAALLAEGDRLAASGAVPLTAGERHDLALRSLARSLTVGIAGRSQIIQVRVTAKDAQLAADITGRIVAHYMETRRAMDRAMATRALAAARERVELLQGEVATAEHEAERFRFDSGLTKGVTGTLAVQELEQARTRLTEASATRARLVAQAEVLERAARTGNWNTVGGSLVSPVVGQLRADAATRAAELAQLAKQYGDRHPRMIELRAQLGQTNAALQAEIQREIAGVRESANVAVDQEKALQAQISKLEERYAGNLSGEGVRLRALEAAAAAKRTLLEAMLGRLEEVQAVAAEDGAPSGIKLVSAAQRPYAPSGPPRALLIAAGGVGSLLAALFAVFALELLQRRVRTPDTVRRILGVGAVHIVPNHPVRRRDGRLYEVFQRHPFSLFSESLRALYRNSLGDLGPVGSIAVTSARPQDGKTSLSLALAQVAGQAGRRVVVVDTDFRRSRVDRLFKLTGQAGLADWLAGGATVDDIVYTADAVPFAMVPAGRLTPGTLDHFDTDALLTLMAGLSTRFDLIVFDTPPALAVSDARVVCAAAAKVLFVTRWGHTTAADLQAVADLGPIDHARFIAVLTDVDLKKAAARGYAGPYRSYLTGSAYYTEPRGGAWAVRG